MTGTILLLFGMLLMLQPVIVHHASDIFGISLALRRAIPLDADTPPDILEALDRIP